MGLLKKLHIRHQSHGSGSQEHHSEKVDQHTIPEKITVPEARPVVDQPATFGPNLELTARFVEDNQVQVTNEEAALSKHILLTPSRTWSAYFIDLQLSSDDWLKSASSTRICKALKRKHSSKQQRSAT